MRFSRRRQPRFRECSNETSQKGTSSELGLHFSGLGVSRQRDSGKAYTSRPGRGCFQEQPRERAGGERSDRRPGNRSWDLGSHSGRSRWSFRASHGLGPRFHGSEVVNEPDFLARLPDQYWRPIESNFFSVPRARIRCRWYMLESTCSANRRSGRSLGQGIYPTASSLADRASCYPCGVVCQSRLASEGLTWTLSRDSKQREIAH